MLLKRESLSILKDTYSFIRESYRTPQVLPFRVLRELRLARAVLPLLRADVSMEWDRHLYVSDASESGIGICRRSLPSELIGSLGRMQEKWRFHTLGCISARRHALGVSPEVSHHEFLSEHINESPPEVAGFCEIPKDIMQPEDWACLHGSRSKQREHITRTEGRALLWSVAHYVLPDGAHR